MARERTIVTYLVDGRPIKVAQQVPFEGSYKGGRGRPVLNTEGESRLKSQATMIFADVDWMLCICWCETEYVGVAQRDVINGETRSCGRPKCFNPDTGDSLIGQAVTTSFVVSEYLVIDPESSGRYVSSDPGTGRDPSAPRNWMPHRKRSPLKSNKKSKARKRKPPAKEKPLEVEQRRDMVESLFQQGKEPYYIATYLRIPYHIVTNDIMYLRVQGKIKRRI